MDAKFMLFWLAEQAAVWSLEAQDINDIPALVAASGYNMAKFVHVCDGEDLYMTDAGRAAAGEHGLNYAMAYEELALRAAELGQLRWKVRPKGHGYLHMLERMKV
jgi:hypothetical protein